MASILSERREKRGDHSLKDLKTLGRNLLSSRAHTNNLPLLLTFVSPSSPPQYVLESLLSLQSFFIPLIPELPPSSSSSLKRSRFKDNSSIEDDDPEVIYRTWVRSKFDEFIKLLIDVLVSEKSDDTLRDIVLDALMDFVKLGNGGRFHSAIYHRLLNAILNSGKAFDILSDMLATKYFNYIDVRYFSYISMEKLVKILEAKGVAGDDVSARNGDAVNSARERMEDTILKMHNILSRIPPLEGSGGEHSYEMFSGTGSKAKDSADNGKPSGISKGEKKRSETEKVDCNVLSPTTIVKKMKLKFTKAWISFLRLPLPVVVYKEVLVHMHKTLIPHLSSPVMLCDFLTKSYDIGGVVSVMALSSLFIIMTQYGLEYPNFYEKLYALLTPSIFMAKHRAKFFQLLDSCLKSPLLPAYLAASFAKKLSRLALSVPPSGSLLIIALIHNLLRRHPSINCLVHRELGETEADYSEAEENNRDSEDERVDTPSTSTKIGGMDYFDNTTHNPVKTNAMRSSLWEIDTLRHHYSPPVSRFVVSLENDLTVRAKTTEVDIKDFSSGSYATVFGNEIRRRVKQVPLAFYKAIPTSLFSDADFPGWTFKGEEKTVGAAEGCGKSFINASEESDKSSSKRQRIECS